MRAPQPAPAPARVQRAPEPVLWDVLANKHVRCAKCQEPVRVTKEAGRVVLDEIDGSAPHECGREAYASLAQAREAARAAIEATLKALVERQERLARGEEEQATEDAAAPARPDRPRRAPRRVTNGEASETTRMARECPSCGRLMAGSGDALVCLYCGA